jgi:hypothetical protein
VLSGEHVCGGRREFNPEEESSGGELFKPKEAEPESFVFQLWSWNK